MTSRVKLAYFYEISLPSRTAASIQILRTARALAQQGLAVDLCVQNVEDPASCLRFYGLTPHPGLRLVPFYPPIDRPRQYARALARYLDDQPAGCVLMSRGMSGLNLARALRRTKRDDVRFVFECHRLTHLPDLGDPTGQNGNPLRQILTQRLLRSREAQALRRADAVVCLTPGIQEDLDKHFGLKGKPTLILPSGVDIPETPEASETPRDIDVLYVGKLAARKGVDHLVHAMVHLPGYRACIVGGDPEQVRRLEALGASLGLSRDAIECVGQIEHGQIASYYRRAKTGVCPLPAGESRITQQYTSPMKLLEMMAHGVPIVASDLRTIRSIVQHEVSALLVPPGDPAALGRALGRLLQDRELAGRLCEKASEVVMDYRWDARARKLKQLLESLR